MVTATLNENLENTGLLFALILAAGFAIGKAKLLSKETKSGLTNLVLYVTLPCTVISSFDVSYHPSLVRGLLFTLLFAIVSQTAGQIFSLVFFRRQPQGQRSVLRYGLIVANSAFFGIPVLSALFGSSALPFGAVFLIPQRIAMWTLGVPCFTNDSDKENRRKMVAKTFVHPAMIAIYLGLLLLFTELSLPATIAKPIDAIAACTMPLTMMLVGSILTELRLHTLANAQIYLYCAVRLVIMPGLVFLVCLLAGQTGMVLQVCVLMAGMPAATTTSLLALRYGADELLGSTLVTISTIFFFCMLPVWFSLFSLVA